MDCIKYYICSYSNLELKISSNNPDFYDQNNAFAVTSKYTKIISTKDTFFLVELKAYETKSGKSTKSQVI